MVLGNPPMPSIKSRLFSLLLRMTKNRHFADGQSLRLRLETGRHGRSSDPPKRLCETFDVRQSDDDGLPVIEINRKGGNPSITLFYLYGSFHLFGMDPLHWGLVSKILARSDVRIIVPLYPLAPQFSWDDTYAALMPLYERVAGSALQDGFVLMGDGSGAGLAAGMSLEAAHQGLSMADQLVLLSPWLDAGLTNHRIADMADTDPWLSVDGAREAALLYAAGHDLKDYRLSPIYGNLENLPPTRIFVGTNEILYPDCVSFADLADACGARIELFAEKDMFHGWMMFTIPEARHTLDEIVHGLPRVSEDAI